MTEEEIIKEAYNRANISYSNATKQSEEEDLIAVNEVYNDHKEYREECELEIKIIQQKADKDKEEYKEKIREMDRIDEDNYGFKEQRERILHQVNVIEYELLNPDLDIF